MAKFRIHHRFSVQKKKLLLCLFPPQAICLLCLLLLFAVKGTRSLPLRMPPLKKVLQKQAAAEISCSECKGPVYLLGLKTHRVPMALYELNRARSVQSMLTALLANHKEQQKETTTNGNLPRGVILLQGRKQTTRYNTDHEPVFRQESYFHWAFGVTDPGVYGAISLPSGDATLFVPQHGIDYEIFCGSSPNPETIRKKHGIENVLPLNQLGDYIASELLLEQQLPTSNNESDNEYAQLFLLSGLNTDLGNYAMPATYDGMHKIPAAKQNTETLFRAIAESRVIKTNAKIELMRYTNYVLSMAHVEVMRQCQPGMMEYQLESLFQHYTYMHSGCRLMSYTCICACGPNPAILHYGVSPLLLYIYPSQ